MILKMYSIHDTKGEIYNAPFFKKMHGEAERDFSLLCKDPKSMPGQFPTDFNLYYVGDYDDQTGKITTPSAPQHIASAIQFKNQIERDPKEVEQLRKHFSAANQ